jgi:hypothetical protein
MECVKSYNEGLIPSKFHTFFKPLQVLFPLIIEKKKIYVNKNQVKKKVNH